MSLYVDWVTIDCKDVRRMAEFWSQALDYEVLDADYDSGEAEALIAPRGKAGARILLLAVPDEKTTKNRLHFDLRGRDQDAEVARLQSLGATRVDIGQGDVSWVVMADPEGNEFCILRSLTDEDRQKPWAWEP